MTRFDEIRARLQGGLEKDTAEFCGLVLHGRRVVIKPTVAPADPALIVAAYVGPRGALDAAAALVYNASAPLGALAIEGKALILRVLCAYDGELEQVIDRLAREAERLAPPTTAGLVDRTQPFEHFL